MPPSETRPLVIACGALVSELRAVLAAAGLEDAVEVRYLPASLHNRPERLPDQVAAVLAETGAGASGRTVVLGYGDCGTGGGFDRLIDDLPNVTRIAGDHCYEFFAGSETFRAEHDAELGTFYLTDFLAKHFDALVWQGLGLDRHPQLRDMYFGNYRRVLLLTQSGDQVVIDAGRAAAERLGLAFELRMTGLDHFAEAVQVGIRTRTEEAV